MKLCEKQDPITGRAERVGNRGTDKVNFVNVGEHTEVHLCVLCHNGPMNRNLFKLYHSSTVQLYHNLLFL